MSKIEDRSGLAVALTAANYDSNVDSMCGIVEAVTGTTYSVDVNDQNRTLEISNAASVAVTLPLVSAVSGANIHTSNFKVLFKNVGAGVATISRAGADTFDDGTTSIALAQGEFAFIQTDSTAAIWNILNAGRNTLLGLTSTVAEINTSTDGSTAAIATTVAATDRVVYNDAGTMKQVDVDDIDTYFSQTTKELTNKTLTTPAITNPTGLDKIDVGLTNVDNTSDATKNAAAVELTNKTISAGTYTGTQTGFTGSVSGNATTATTLQTARTLNGTSFNGSANITVPTNNASINPTDTTMYPMLSPTNTTGNKSLSTDGGLVYNASTNTLTTTTFSGTLSGNSTTATTAGSITSQGALATRNSVSATEIDANAVGSSEIAANAVSSSEINKTPTAATSQSVATTGWVPPAGLYNFVGATAEVSFQLLIGGTWYGTWGSNVHHGGLFLCDGTNMRLRAGVSTTTVWYQKF